jgi:hypothetical protein
MNIYAPILDAAAPTVFMVLLWAYLADRKKGNCHSTESYQNNGRRKAKRMLYRIIQEALYTSTHQCVFVLLLPSFVVCSMVEIQEVNLTFMYKDLT